MHASHHARGLAKRVLISRTLKASKEIIEKMGATTNLQSVSSAGLPPLDIFSIKKLDQLDHRDARMLHSSDQIGGKEQLLTLRRSSTTPQTSISTEDILLTKTNPFSIIDQFYNPILVHTLRKLDYKGKRINNRELSHIVQMTEKRLLKTHTAGATFKPEKLDFLRREIEQKLPLIVGSNLSEVDAMYLLTCMAISMPPAMHHWLVVDNEISRIVPRFSMYASLYCAYCISSSISKIGFDPLKKPFKSKTAAVVMNRLIKQSEEKGVAGLHLSFQYIHDLSLRFYQLKDCSISTLSSVVAGCSSPISPPRK